MQRRRGSRGPVPVPEAPHPGEIAEVASLRYLIPDVIFSWKRRWCSPSKVMERTHEEATEALHALREGRHSEAASA